MATLALNLYMFTISLPLSPGLCITPPRKPIHFVIVPSLSNICRFAGRLSSQAVLRTRNPLQHYLGMARVKV